MSRNEQQIHEMIGQAWDMPHGAAQIALAEQAMAHADAQRFEELSFDARMLATTAYIYGGEPAKSFVTFSWCRTEYDNDPVRYARWTHTLMWYFKNIVGAMTKFPEIPLARTADVLDDMDRRWRAAGHSMHAVYAHRHIVARHVGDNDEAATWFDKWNTAPRDALSDCVGCDPTSKAYWLASQGRDEEAVALAEPVLAGTLTCSEQPQGIWTMLLLPYLRTDRHEQARDAHRRAYRIHRSRLADLGDIADHVHFCAVTSNDARGLEIVERHLDWLDKAPSPWATMHFAAASALVLRRLDRSGHGATTVRRRGSGGQSDVEVPVGALAEELAATALAVAGRFDARNGTSYRSDRIREVLVAEPIVDSLRLAAAGSRHTPAPAIPTPRSHDQGVPEDVRGDQGRPDHGETPPVEVPETDGPDALLTWAERAHRADRDDEALAGWRAFDARYGDTELTALQRARRAEGTGNEQVDTDEAAALAVWREAMALYAEAGDEVRRHNLLGRVGVAIARTGDAEAGTTMIEESTAFLVDHAPAAYLARAHMRRAYACATSGRFDEALADLDAVEPLLDGESDPRARPNAIGLRAQVLGAIGRLDEAEPVAAACREIHRGEPGAQLAHACFLHGRILQEIGRPADAVAAYDEALAQPFEDDDMRQTIRRMRAVLLAGSPRAAEAIDPLVEDIAALTAGPDREGVPHLQHQLAIAYLNAGRTLDAAEIAEEAVATFDEAGDPHALDVRDLLAAIYERLGERDAVVGQLTTIADAMSAAGDDADPGELGEVQERLAETLDKQDRDAAAAQRFAQAAAGYAAAGRPIDEARVRRRHAMSLLWSSRPDDAVASMDQAVAFVDGLPAGEPAVVWERALIDYDAARMLSRIGRLDEAVERAGASVERFRGIEAGVQAGHAGVLKGELLEAADREKDAETAYEAALVDFGDDEQGRARAQEALDDLRD